MGTYFCQCRAEGESRARLSGPAKSRKANDAGANPVLLVISAIFTVVVPAPQVGRIEIDSLDLGDDTMHRPVGDHGQRGKFACAMCQER